MAIVKEIRDGPCTIIVHDDAVAQTSEERQKIIDNVSRIVIRALSAKEEPARGRERRTSCGAEEDRQALCLAGAGGKRA